MHISGFDHLPGPVSQARQFSPSLPSPVSNEGIALASTVTFFTYLFNILTRETPKGEFKDYPKCGLRDETAKDLEDECIWSCKWKINPHYRQSSTYSLSFPDYEDYDDYDYE